MSSPTLIFCAVVENLLLRSGFDRVLVLQPALKSFEHEGDVSVSIIFKYLEDGVVNVVLRRCCVDDDSSGLGNFAEPLIQFCGRDRAGAGDPFLLELFRWPDIDELELFAGVEKKLEAINRDGRNVPGFMPGLCYRRRETEQPDRHERN